jgi:WD40 repeat protein
LAASASYGQSKLKNSIELKHHDDLRFQSAVFAPDGNRLVSVGNKGMVYLWDADQNFPVGFRQVHKGNVVACAFSRDGKYIVTGGDDKTIHILQQGKDLQVIKSIEGLPAPVREIAMNGKRMVALLQNNEIRLYNTDTWERVGKPRYAANNSRLVFSNSGDRFYYWFASRLYSVSAKDGHQLKLFNTNYATPTDLAISADDKYLAVGFGQADEILRVYATRDMSLVESVKKNGPGDYASGLAFFHHGPKLLYYSRSASTNLKILDVEKGTNTGVAKISDLGTTSISKDNSKVVLASKQSNYLQVMAVM